MKTFAALAAVCAFLAPATAEARHTQAAKVRYETSQGKSRWYNVDVNFLTGKELNQATSSFLYNSFKNYAVVFWGDDQASIILIQSPMIFCSLEFESSCLPLLGKMKGPDQEGRQWEVCTALFCG